MNNLLVSILLKQTFNNICERWSEAPGRGSRNIDESGSSVIPPGLPGLGIAPDAEILGAPVAVYE